MPVQKKSGNLLNAPRMFIFNIYVNIGTESNGNAVVLNTLPISCARTSPSDVVYFIFGSS